MARKKPRIGFQVEPEDKRALDAITWLVQRDMPGLGEQSASILMRAALRLGLAEIVEDPSRIVSTRAPDVKAIEDERAAAQEDAMQDAYEQHLLDGAEDMGRHQGRRASRERNRSMDVVVAAKGLGLAISTVNGLRQLVTGWTKGVKPPEEEIRQAELGLNDLLAKLGSLTTDLVGLQQENIELREQVSKLKRSADLDARRIFVNGAFYINAAPEGFGSGPYCSACWANEKYVPIVSMGMLVPAGIRHQCPACQAVYNLNLVKLPEILPPQAPRGLSAAP